MPANKKIITFNLVILLLPSIYLAIIWNQLPQTIPMHYDIDGKVNRWGDKSELLMLNAILLFVGAGVTLLMLFINRIDPKQEARTNQKVLEKISVVVSLLLALIQCYVLFVTLNQKFTSPKPILVAVSLLFTFLGNLMRDVKPNYFVGIRTPWTLENEEVWEKTHHFGSRLWFWAGLILALLVLVLPMLAATIVFVAGIVIIAFIPMIYSYRLFKQIKKA